MSANHVIKRSPVIEFPDSGNFDAFGHLRVANPYTLLQVQNQYDGDPLLMESNVSGTGVAVSHNANTRMAKVSCTAGTGQCHYQSYQYTPYQPGKSQYCAITFVLGAGVAGASVDVGYFDDDNGVFLNQNGTSGLRVTLRSKTSGSVVDTTVTQSSWNVDPMDGTGPSGVTIDETKAQILVFDLQYLGMGRVRCYFNVNGVLYKFHEFLNANSLAVPYMQTAALPVRMSVEATSTASTKEAHFKCAAVISEGGVQDFGYRFATNDSGAINIANGALTHVLSLRPLTTFNSITNRQQLVINEVDLINTGTKEIRWAMCVGCAFSGTASWADVNSTYSGSEQDSADTYSTGGIMIDGGYLPASGQIKGSFEGKLSNKYPITLNKTGATRALGTVTLLAEGLGGASTVRAMLTFEEIR